MEDISGETKKVFQAHNIARSVALNTLWGSTGRLLGGVFAFFSSIFLFRALGPGGAGSYATVLAFFYLFNALADGGFYNILLRDMARNEEGASRLAATAFTLRLISLFLSMSVGLVVFTLIPRYHGMFSLAALSVMFYVALSFVQLLMAVFQHYLVVLRATRAEITARLGQLLATGILFLVNVRSVRAYLLVLFGSSALQLVLLARSARSLVRIRMKTTRQEARRMIQESFPVALGFLFTLVYFRLDTVLLSLLKTPHEVGIYSLSYKILEQLIFFPAMFMGVLTPVLSRAMADPQRFQELFSRAAGIITMGAAPVLACGWFLAKPAVVLLGGEAFSISSEPLRPLLLATVLIFLGTLYGATVIILGKQRQAIPVYALGMVVNLTGNLLFIPVFSYMGAAWSTAFTELIIDAGLLLILFSGGINPKTPKLRRILLAASFAALPFLLFGGKLSGASSPWMLVVFLPLYFTLYASGLLKLHVLSLKELFALRQSS